MELEAALQEAQQKFEDQTQELERVNKEYRLAQLRLKDTEAEMELRAEVERLKAVERARDEERELSTLWATDLRERFCTDGQVLEHKFASLKAKLASKATPMSGTGSSGMPASSSSSIPSVTSLAPATSATSTAPSSVVTASGGTSSGSSGMATSTLTSSSTGTSTVVSSSSPSTSTTDATHMVMSTGSTEMLKRLLETQSQLLAAQMQAATLSP